MSVINILSYRWINKCTVKQSTVESNQSLNTCTDDMISMEWDEVSLSSSVATCSKIWYIVAVIQHKGVR